MATPRKPLNLGKALRVPVDSPLATPKAVKRNEVGDQTPTNESIRQIDYEFNAPQYFDFTKDSVANDEDWFDNRNPSPDLSDNCSNQENYRDSLNSTTHFTVSQSNQKHHSTTKIKMKGLTIPKEFNFTKKTTVSMLRKRKQSPKVMKKTSKYNGLTIPKPFQLSNTTRYQPTKKEPSSPFVPLAVKVQAFLNDTPDRFRVKPKSKQLNRILQNKLTQPKSPMLNTKLRSRQMQRKVLSRDEKEELEMKNMEQFKARKLNHKILETAVGVKPVKPLPLTIPMSPAIQKVQPKPEPKPIQIKPVKANPLPDFSNPFVPAVEHRQLEIPEYQLPGDFIHEKMRRDIERKKELELKQLKKSREFKAQPMIDTDKVYIPEHEIQITQPKPFALETDFRGEKYRKTFKAQLKKLLNEEKRRADFHAAPVPSLEPFTVKRSDRPLTETEQFVSHLDQRAQDRQQFELEQRERQLLEERERLRLEEIRLAQEKKEIQKLREAQTHKAQPIKHFVPVHTKPSEKKLTEPQTPMFVRRYRKEKQRKS
ncbi:hypothetical protein BC833DRAFT_591723 [Globomyces pollinis-pini]|nr:hypothetical protein BC833DRAFT_591723 [Globomyces pollinis-pini]